MTKDEFIADFKSRLYKVMRDTAAIADANGIKTSEGIPTVTLELCVATHIALSQAKPFFPGERWSKALQIYLDVIENGAMSAAIIHGFMNDEAQ